MVDCDKPFMLSKNAMKKAEMSTAFLIKTIKIFQLKQNVLFTSVVHSCIPLGNHIENVEKLLKDSTRVQNQYQKKYIETTLTVQPSFM